MYNKILVALDGSKLSESILPYARFFGKALKTHLELLHVIDPDALMPSVIAQQGHYDDIMTAEKKNTDEYLRSIAVSLSDSPSVDCSVDIGKPADVIVNRAAAQPGTLIAMATHGRSGVQRWLLGSVAEKVLQIASNPLLIVRGTHDPKAVQATFKRVVVPLDGSDLAEKALPHASDLAKRMDLEIVLLRVYALPLIYGDAARYYSPYGDQLLELVEEEAKQYVEQKAAQLEKEGVRQVSSVVVKGDSAEQIMDFARKTPDNLIAMCTHGRSGIARLVLGSVTGRVVRHAGDPTLIIRAATANATA